MPRELAIASDGVVLYSVTADETRPLGGAGADSVAWSPDGRTIAFTRIPPGLNDSHHDLWLMDADGTNERILVPDIRAMHGLGPVWSPDGERIAYQRLCDYQLADPTAPCVRAARSRPAHRERGRSARTSRHPGGHPTTADHRTPRADLVVSVECHLVARRHHTALSTPGPKRTPHWRSRTAESSQCRWTARHRPSSCPQTSAPTPTPVTRG